MRKNAASSPGRKEASRRKRQKLLDEQAGRSLAQGFLHIPKTGGSSMGYFLRDLSKENVVVPIKFPHSWTMRDIATSFPDTKVSFVIRDPLERMISAFLYRQRVGSSWTPAEAVAMSFFSRPEDFLGGLLSRDERTKSAALFTYRQVKHFRMNYIYYFESPEYIDQIRGRHFGIIGRIGSYDDFVTAYCRLCGIDPSAVGEKMEVQRKSNVSSQDVLATIGDEDIEQLKSVLSDEYAIYDRLVALSDGPA